MKDMTNKETAAEIRRKVKYPGPNQPFSWVTDVCGYDQHIRFVLHRNKHWNKDYQGDSFAQFCLEYADMLEAEEQKLLNYEAYMEAQRLKVMEQAKEESHGRETLSG